VPAPPVTSTRFTARPRWPGRRSRWRRRRPGRHRSSPTGRRPARRRAPVGDPPERAGPAELRVVGREHDRVGVGDRLLERLRRRRHVRIVDGHVGQLALQQAHELVGQRVALVVGPGLERSRARRPSCSRSVPRRRFIPSTRNSGRTRGRRETARSIPGAWRALLGEREVLAQARARVRPGWAMPPRG
jgi:hypothetical protein